MLAFTVCDFTARPLISTIDTLVSAVPVTLTTSVAGFGKIEIAPVNLVGSSPTPNKRVSVSEVLRTKLSNSPMAAVVFPVPAVAAKSKSLGIRPAPAPGISPAKTLSPLTVTTPVVALKLIPNLYQVEACRTGSVSLTV